ncbi:MAG: glucose-6-phosphate isomerase [Oscillospiraceae bacterium]|nr:glucose-6-phosphate isomerase [Oscillospiraceae bacterium]
MTLTLCDNSGLLGDEKLSELTEKNKPYLEAMLNGKDEFKDSAGWVEPGKQAYLEECEWLGTIVRQNADVLVVIGVGGSNRAARAVYECLGSKSYVKIEWAGLNYSASEMNALLRRLEGKSVYINVIAKNFKTLEPGLWFRVLRNWLRDEYGEEYSQRIICTGTPGSDLNKLADDNDYYFLPFPENVCGRYSALTPVALFPLAVTGFNIREMLGGATVMRMVLQKADNNPALMLASARNYLYGNGFKLEMLSFFEPSLERFSKWWVQMFAESEGKNGKGLYPVVGSFTEDLHSIGQYIQQGEPILYEIFLNVMNPEDRQIDSTDIPDGFEYLDGKSLNDVNSAAFKATLATHSERFPCLRIDVVSLDEFTFGELFYFFMFTCCLSAKILGVNPFDQPGVEGYKEKTIAGLKANI